MSQQCIYCCTQLDPTSQSDDLKPSKEHIVPVALGGSGLFITYDACARCNSGLGERVDSPFIDMLPLAIKRHELKLEGNNGVIPPIIWQATSLKDGRKSRITISSDDNVDISFKPEVQNVDQGNYSKRLITGNRDQVTSIFKGMADKAKIRGQKFFTQSGSEIMHSDDAVKYFEIEEHDTFHASVVAFDKDIWLQGILKIILGLGHFIAGPDWTFSPNGGDPIRTVLACHPSMWPRQKMKGIICGSLPNDIKKILGITNETKAKNIHTRNPT